MVFSTYAGLLSFEELSLINRGFKTADPIQSISRASKHIQTHIGSHQDQTSSKSGDLPLGALEAELFKDVKPDIHKLTKKSNVCKTASFTSSTTENNPKVHHSVESPSSGLSKRTRRKINYRNTKPTTISSGTSPASHFHVAISESDFQSPPHPPCHNFGERKFKKQCSTRFSIGNITPSGLRMPSPRIGFFDEEQPLHLNNKESNCTFLDEIFILENLNKDGGKMGTYVENLKKLLDDLKADMPNPPSRDTGDVIECIFSITKTNEIDVQNPTKAVNKGEHLKKRERLKSEREKAITAESLVSTEESLVILHMIDSLI
ncbi:hypothetical protein Tco_1417146, partial [Tanacetum coccineum]